MKLIRKHARAVSATRMESSFDFIEMRTLYANRIWWNNCLHVIPFYNITFQLPWQFAKSNCLIINSIITEMSSQFSSFSCRNAEDKFPSEPWDQICVAIFLHLNLVPNLSSSSVDVAIRVNKYYDILQTPFFLTNNDNTKSSCARAPPNLTSQRKILFECWPSDFIYNPSAICLHSNNRSLTSKYNMNLSFFWPTPPTLVTDFVLFENYYTFVQVFTIVAQQWYI